MNKIELANLIKRELSLVMLESKQEATFERQEHLFVLNVNHHASLDHPISVLFAGNNYKIENVVGVNKVIKKPAYGKQPYTDVLLRTTDSSYNISMKGPSSPSFAGGGGAGIEHIIPGWLQTVTPKVIERMLFMGYKDGDVFVYAPATLKQLMDKIARVYTKKHGVLPVYFTGYPDGKVYVLNAVKRGKKYAHEGEIIPYIGNPEIVVTNTQITIKNTVGVSDERSSLPDMYFKIKDYDVMHKLLRGVEAIGGPIDYIFRGPMDVRTDWDKASRILTIAGTKLYTIEAFLEAHPDLYLRVRKRRADQPFTSIVKHAILGNSIFGTGLFSSEKAARIVVVDKLSSKAELGEPI